MKRACKKEFPSQSRKNFTVGSNSIEAASSPSNQIIRPFKDKYFRIKNRFLLLLVFFLCLNMLFMLLNSCSNHNEGKAVTRCGYFNKAALMAMDDADSIPRQPRDSGVLAKAFLLELTLWDVTWTCSAASHRFHGNEAYATVPSPGPTYEPNITSVTITSDHDFDANHPAGTELKDLFINTDPQYFHAGTNNLYLMHAPAQVSTHVFTIRLLFTDSSKNLVSSALPVKLLL